MKIIKLYIVVTCIFASLGLSAQSVHIERVSFGVEICNCEEEDEQEREIVGDFIELYNSSSKVINLSNWRLESNNIIISLSKGLYIQPKSSFFIVHRSSNELLMAPSLHPGLSEWSNKIVFISDFSLFSDLNDIGESNTITLSDANNLLIDNIQYDTELALTFRYLNRKDPHNEEYVIARRLELSYAPGMGQDVVPKLEDPVVIIVGWPEPADPYIPPIQVTNPIYNYIAERIMLEADSSEYLETVNYYDGMGRLKQAIQRNINGSGNDLITTQEYQGLELKGRAWLPVPVTNNNGRFFNDSLSFAITTYNGDSRPFSEPVYEPSPLNRIVEQYGPGENWHSKGKSVRTEYLANINSTGNVLSCYHYKVSGTAANPTLTKSNNYAANQLYVTKMTDEDGNVMYEFKNKLGQVVLTRQMNGTTLHDTYYVYDDFGNLVFVLPPLAADYMNSNTTWNYLHIYVSRYVYLYRYDERNRCIYKKIPGSAPVYYLYDDADRLIFSQDGEQRNREEWSFAIPDNMGRTVLQGICTNPQLAASTIVSASYMGINTNGGYLLSGFSCANSTILQVNYYDNYLFRSSWGSEFNYLTPTGFEDKRYGIDADFISAKGMLTGSLTALLDGSTTMLGSVYYYDNKGRMIQSIFRNHLNGYEKEYINYTFAGQPEWRRMLHTADFLNCPYDALNPLVQTYTYAYDHAGRLTDTWYQVGGDDEILLSKLQYDELGRINRKSIHADRVPVTYAYNIRSWMKNIQSTEFSQSLYYNESYQSNTPRYNGNISAQSYRSGTTNNSFFRYNYDGLNRLTGSTFSGYPADNSFNEEMEYDKHGNITSLLRYHYSSQANRIQFLDWLEITYNGNQLKRASNFVYPSEGFIDRPNPNVTSEYVYNGNGAMTQDLNKGITGIEYNVLNLPNRISFDDTNDILYLYDAAGVKRRVLHSTTQSLTGGGFGIGGNGIFVLVPTDYCGPVVYESGKLKRILTSEGYLTLNEATAPVIGGGFEMYTIDDAKDTMAELLTEMDLTSGEEERMVIVPVTTTTVPAKDPDPGISFRPPRYRYSYFINDYLGNVRTVLTWNKNGKLTTDYTVTQRNDYYAWGLPTSTSLNPEAQPYKREGKEYDEMHGLNWADFHNRYFDFALPSTPTPDKHAENYYSISPYTLYGGNPVSRIDPDGMDWYEDEHGNAMWRNINDEEYTDDNGNVWTNIGTSHTETFGNVKLYFSQKEDDEGNLTLHSSGTIEQNGIIYVYDPETGMRGGILGEKGLENVYPEFDLLFIFRGIFNSFTKRVVKEGAAIINQSSKAILKNGYYEVNGFKFTEYYYIKLWSTGRGAPSLVAKEVLKGGAKTATPDSMTGFYRYIYGGWEMIYNPITKEVHHLLPIK